MEKHRPQETLQLQWAGREGRTDEIRRRLISWHRKKALERPCLPWSLIASDWFVFTREFVIDSPSTTKYRQTKVFHLGKMQLLTSRDNCHMEGGSVWRSFCSKTGEEERQRKCVLCTFISEKNNISNNYVLFNFSFCLFCLLLTSDQITWKSSPVKLSHDFTNGFISNNFTA